VRLAALTVEHRSGAALHRLSPQGQGAVHQKACTLSLELMDAVCACRADPRPGHAILCQSKRWSNAPCQKYEARCRNGAAGPDTRPSVIFLYRSNGGSSLSTRKTSTFQGGETKMASNVYLSIWGALWLIANMCFSAECTAQERPPLQPRPERGPVSPPQPLPQACSRITSFTPASARPGESVDIFLEPGSRASLRYTVVGVEFTSGVSAVFTPISLTEARTKVPLAATAGHLRVYCRTIFGAPT
jgi:hypothetical protein